MFDLAALHAAYISIGLPPARFWRITPRLCIAEMRAMRDRLTREKNDHIELAWMVANLSRAKSLPKLQDLLVTGAPKQPQTTDEQQAFFDLLAASWGAKREI